jgi:hypothetical protein
LKKVQRKFELVLKEAQRKSLNFGMAGMCILQILSHQALQQKKPQKPPQLGMVT